ncbi:hypothetical protein CMK11_04100, partial [Candidatus Poribacteria bacterium]|nr:hypothetical protein [Candidatus Poribacteria bacterium]
MEDLRDERETAGQTDTHRLVGVVHRLMIAGIGVAVYSTGGDFAKLQKFGEEASTTTQIAMSLFGAFFALLGG